MTPTRGYYCLVQYCPDDSRAEAANIGVVLYCPERHYLEVRTSEGHDRVRRFFGKDSFDPERLDDAKRALENRLRREREWFRSQEDLTRFVETRTNGIGLTLPRPVKVLNPEEELNSLFLSLVGMREQPTAAPRSQLVQQLKTLFSSPTLKGKVLRNQEVTVPVVGTILRAPYAFKNGKLNLICSLNTHSRTVSKAKELALEGDLLRRHENEMSTPAALWVALASPVDAETAEERDRAEQILHDYELPVYREEQLDEMRKRIEAEAH